MLMVEDVIPVKAKSEQVVEMQFLADVHLTCEVCNGKRFKDEVLEVKYKNKSIHDILELSVDEAIKFFKDEKELHKKLYAFKQRGIRVCKTGTIIRYLIRRRGAAR